MALNDADVQKLRNKRLAEVEEGLWAVTGGRTGAEDKCTQIPECASIMGEAAGCRAQDCEMLGEPVSMCAMWGSG